MSDSSGTTVHWPSNSDLVGIPQPHHLVVVELYQIPQQRAAVLHFGVRLVFHQVPDFLLNQSHRCGGTRSPALVSTQVGKHCDGLLWLCLSSD